MLNIKALKDDPSTTEYIPMMKPLFDEIMSYYPFISKTSCLIFPFFLPICCTFLFFLIFYLPLLSFILPLFLSFHPPPLTTLCTPFLTLLLSSVPGESLKLQFNETQLNEILQLVVLNKRLRLLAETYIHIFLLLVKWKK